MSTIRDIKGNGGGAGDGGAGDSGGANGGAWPETATVRLSADVEAALPLVRVREGFAFYSFDMLGRARWNKAAAGSLAALLRGAGVSFDALVTAEAKAIGLAEEMAALLGLEEYVVLRKSKKAYMRNPAQADVKSITTETLQRFYLDEAKFPLLAGRRVLYLDDVVSTGGTLEAVFTLSQNVGFTVAAIACVLTEGARRTEVRGVPLFCLDHIPLPDMTKS